MTNEHIYAVGIGEVLLDVFEDGAETVGGAPLNVTFHLNQLMHALSVGEARFISRVGRDASGKKVLDYLAAADMNVDFVSQDETLPTGTALVFTDSGHAGFEIAQNVAWDQIQADLDATGFARQASAVVFGSLAQRSSVSRETVRRTVAAVRGERLYDVNLRRNTRSHIAGYSEGIIRSSLELATIVKLSDEEIDEVSSLMECATSQSSGVERRWEQMTLLANQFHLSMVALTRGAKGALILCDGERFCLPDSTLPQDNVHPVGAGDAFAAGLLFGRIQGWETRQCLEMAEIMATWVVQNVSATPRLTEDVVLKVHALHEKTALSRLEESVA